MTLLSKAKELYVSEYYEDQFIPAHLKNSCLEVICAGRRRQAGRTDRAKVTSAYRITKAQKIV